MNYGLWIGFIKGAIAAGVIHVIFGL